MFNIYCDGACSGNPGPGGWAYVIIDNNDVRLCTGRGYDSQTTNNRMEMMAMIEAVKALAQRKDFSSDSTVVIHTDSAYVANCYIQRWWEAWVENNWLTSKRESVKNKDLWEQLIPIFKNKNIKLHKVDGHSGNHWNEVVDKMAVEARKNLC